MPPAFGEGFLRIAPGARMLPRPLRLLIVVGVFAAAGPPIGGIVAWVMMGAQSMRSPLPFLTGAFGEAAALALGAGVLVAAAALAGRTSALVPLAAAILIDLLMFAITGSLSFAALGDGTFLRVAYVFVPPSLIAAFACWLLTRRLLTP